MYFGYPQAHEDDAQRAVRAGLGMVEAMGPLNAPLGCDHGVRLAVQGLASNLHGCTPHCMRACRCLQCGIML